MHTSISCLASAIFIIRVCPLAVGGDREQSRAFL